MSISHLSGSDLSSFTICLHFGTYHRVIVLLG
jgi:hypothetical protein